MPSLHGVSVQVFVDTIGDAGRYQSRLEREILGVNFTVCPKADAIYPIVSAASIAAKVTRDQLQGSTEGECGSGYPGDAVTVAWLRERLHPVRGFPLDVRCDFHHLPRLLWSPHEKLYAFALHEDFR
jgi:ribonuclease H2 subunit A